MTQVIGKKLRLMNVPVAKEQETVQQLVITPEGRVRKKETKENIETTDVIVYTLNQANLGIRTVFTSENAVEVIVPTNSVSPIPVGARRELTAQGDGIVTIGGPGITFTTNLSLIMVKGETRILTKIATDTWTVQGNHKQMTPVTRFSKNINPLTATNIFYAEADLGQEIFADMQGLTGKIYPVGVNTYTDMLDGDIIESSFIIQKQQGPTSANYVLGFDIFSSSSAGTEPILIKNFDYSWDTILKDTLNVKVIFNKISAAEGAWNLVNFLILIEGVFVYASGNFFTYSTADIRMKLTNYDIGVKTINFRQLQAINLFIPSVSSIK